MKFKLPYYCSDNGDGSVSVRFMPTKKEAESHPNAEEGWGESSAGEVELKVEDGKLFFSDYKTIKNEFKRVWIEVGKTLKEQNLPKD